MNTVIEFLVLLACLEFLGITGIFVLAILMLFIIWKLISYALVIAILKKTTDKAKIEFNKIKEFFK